MNNDVLLIAALRLIKAWDSDNIVKGSPAFLTAIADLRKAASLYKPIDVERINKALA